MDSPVAETDMDAIEALHDHVEEARKLHGADYGAARDCVMERIKGHRYIIREAAMVGIMTLLYRNQNNIQRLLKGKDPAFISPMPGHCIRGKEAMSAASVALDDWIVSYSGKLLFDSTREDLAAAAEWQRKCTDAEKAVKHGYKPANRAILWNIEDAIVKVGGPYRALYDERKIVELAKGLTKMHAHNRAKRYVGKRLLRDLWNAWNGRSQKSHGFQLFVAPPVPS